MLKYFMWPKGVTRVKEVACEWMTTLRSYEGVLKWGFMLSFSLACELIVWPGQFNIEGMLLNVFYVKEKVDPGPTYVLRMIHSVERALRVFILSSMQLIRCGCFFSMFPYGGFLMDFFVAWLCFAMPLHAFWHDYQCYYWLNNNLRCSK